MANDIKGIELNYATITLSSDWKKTQGEKQIILSFLHLF